MSRGIEASPPALVVVEAHGKCDLIRRVLRRIGIHAVVMATLGHVGTNPRALRPVCLDEDLKETSYAINPDREQLLSSIESAAQNADRIYIATDDDQEGDVIAADVAARLGLYSDKLFRVRLRAVTEVELDRAFRSELSSDFKLAANNGICRRIVDRAIGAAYTQFGTSSGISVGRVQGSLLCAASEDPVPRGEMLLDARLGDGVYRAQRFLHGDQDPDQELSRIQGQLDRGEAQVVGREEVDRPGGTLWGFEQVVGESAARLNLSLQDAERGFQQAYERGMVSYPRVRANGVTQEGLEVLRELARSSRSLFDQRLLPRRPDISGRMPHETPRPLDDQLNLGRSLALCDTPEAIAVLISRNLIECGQLVHVSRAKVRLNDGDEFVLEREGPRPRLGWDLPSCKPGWHPYGPSQAILRYMARRELGRPSTVVGHVQRFLSRGLVDPDSMALTRKGERWRAHMSACGIEANTSRWIESELDREIKDPFRVAREILGASGHLPAVLEVIRLDASRGGAELSGESLEV